MTALGSVIKKETVLCSCPRLHNRDDFAYIIAI